MGWSAGKVVMRAAGRAAVVAAMSGAAALAIGSASCLAQIATSSSGGQYTDDAADGRVRRIVRIFDFEEPNNPDPMPRDWFRAQETRSRPRPGFPLYNEAAFDHTGGRNGGTAVVLPVRGGSNSLRLMPGVIPVLPFGDYALTAWVRTDRLTHARAFVAIRLLDERGEPLPGAEVRTEPIRTNTDLDEPGPWRPISLRLAGRHEDAAYLQIDCELLQPAQFGSEAALGDEQVLLEDMDGRAWLDDVIVYQLPRIHLSRAMDPASEAAAADQPPLLEASVQDLAAHSLQARVTVRDLEGSVVASQEALIRADGEPWRWRPPIQQYGWYTAELHVSALGLVRPNEAATIGATRMQFAWLPSGSSRHGGRYDSDRRRFGIIADRLPEEHLDALPQLVRQSGAHFVHLWAWRPEDTVATFEARQSQRTAVIDQLASRGHDITLVVATIPQTVAARTHVDVHDPLALVRLDESEWGPYLHPILDRYGQRIRRWNIVAAQPGWGRLGAHPGRLALLEGGSFWMNDLRSDMVAFDEVVRRLAPGPVIGLGWRADWALPADLLAARTAPVPAFVPSQPPTPGSPVLDAVTMTYPAWMPPASMELLAAELGEARDASGHAPEVTLVLDLPAAGEADARGRVIETMRRTIEFWQAFGEDDTSRIALDHPWTVDSGRSISVSQVHAGPEMAVWRTLCDQLSGRRILGSLNLTPGVRCYFLAEHDPSTGALARGALVAWNESSDRDKATLAFLAGDSPLTVVDAFGNRTKLSQSQERTQRITVGEIPVFIEGIDPYVARFISEFRIDQPFIEAISAIHERELILHNPWPTSLEVHYQLRPPRHGEPGEWDVSPRGTERLFIAPGKTERVPVSLRFSPGEMAGRQEMEVVFRLRTDRDYPPLVLKRPLEIGLSDLELTPDFILMPAASGPDVSIVAMLTNTGSTPRTLRMEVRAPGQPSQVVHISNLEPGGTTRRQFYFPDAAAALSGKAVMIKVEDNDSPVYLRKAVVIP